MQHLYFGKKALLLQRIFTLRITKTGVQMYKGIHLLVK